MFLHVHGGIFYVQATKFHGCSCCVTHLCLQFNIEQSVEVCDASKVAMENECPAQKNYSAFAVDASNATPNPSTPINAKDHRKLEACAM